MENHKSVREALIDDSRNSGVFLTPEYVRAFYLLDANMDIFKERYKIDDDTAMKLMVDVSRSWEIESAKNEVSEKSN